MSFATLAVIGLAGIFGPLLALPTRWHLPPVNKRPYAVPQSGRWVNY